ncbi:MAG: hypothetical protein K2X49_17570, partial [Acetobacteraceae bacterium]|nr:hypothetical protein [Acetobacteraceae bacterium]
RTRDVEAARHAAEVARAAADAAKLRADSETGMEGRAAALDAEKKARALALIAEQRALREARDAAKKNKKK